jgi:hypothetical protein
MTDKEGTVEWLCHGTEQYHSKKDGNGDVIEDLGDEGKLGQGFAAVDDLEEVDIGDGSMPRPTYMNTSMPREHKDQVCYLIREFSDCFVWSYTEMLGLSRDLIEHRLPIKKGFRPFRQPSRHFNPILFGRIKEEVDRLLKAGFIRPCRYVEWVSNIIPVEKKNTNKLRIDLRNLNKATPKDEYPMPIADVLINNALGNKVISFLDGNVRYNQIFMVERDISKMVFRCLGFVKLFEWVVMTFGLKNAGATYQCAMNLIFHNLLGIVMEVYIDDVVVKLANFASHLANLRLAFERTQRYGLKMNSHKCLLAYRLVVS